jgi:hypothetical protein
MFNSKGFLKWLAGLGTGALTFALAYLAEGLGAFDPATVTSEPWVAALVVGAVAALSRFVGWLIGLLGEPSVPAP